MTTKRIKLSDMLAACRKDKLTTANLHAMAIIHEHGHITKPALLEILNATDGATSNYIKNLTAANAVRSVRKSSREWHYELTDFGKKVVKAFQMTGGAE